jgi:hypothetical protein
MRHAFVPSEEQSFDIATRSPRIRAVHSALAARTIRSDGGQWPSEWLAPGLAQTPAIDWQRDLSKADSDLLFPSAEPTGIRGLNYAISPSLGHE